MDIDIVQSLCDLSLNAEYLLFLKNHECCYNCGTTDFIQKRFNTHKYGNIDIDYLFCNKCGLKDKKGQFCKHCYYTYRYDDLIKKDEGLTCPRCKNCVYH
jgi:hypothetical protein